MQGNDAAEVVAVPGAELPGVLRDWLRRRGLTEPEQLERYLQPDYERDLGDPHLMKDMRPAIDRLVRAIREREQVAIYGDYDIDGVASTALMYETLEAHGLQPITYIPDRFEEGYGLNVAALEKLREQGASLVVTVDCGITSVAEAAWAREHGLDLIITDHHEVPDELPRATAVINPKQPGDAYPFKELAGVGVAFAVARALQRRTGIPVPGKEKWLLDLVALGTVCDVMPLVDENRCLVKYGLIVLGKTRRVGLVALAQSAGFNLEDARTYHLGFMLGPRLNAAGRLEHASFALELLLTDDPVEAQQIAFQLEELNAQRQLEQARIITEANAMAEQQADSPVLVLADPSWSHGVVGIVAGKVAEKWQKPTLVLQVLGDDAKGSGRSAGGYNLIEGLRAQQSLFTKLGGHEHAAGFTLPVAQLDALRQHLAEHHASVAAALPPRQTREADVALEDLAEVNFDLHSALELLEPFGQGNPQPAFGASGLKVIDVSLVGKDRSHLKLKLAGPEGGIFEAMGFGLAERYPNIRSGQAVDAVFFLEKNTFNDRTSLQFVLLSLQ